MTDTIASYIDWKSRRGPEAGIAPKAAPQLNPEPRDQQCGFSKMFRWPAEQSPKPTSVEVVCSFTDWQRVPMIYDKVTKTWQTLLHNTHRYVILVDGNPSYDKNCDGLTVPQGPEEDQWQIATPRGPRVMLLFAQTK